MRDLNENAGAVAGFGIASAGAAMSQVDEDLNPLLDDLMAFFSANAGDKSHAAGVVLVRGIVETLRGWQTVVGFPVHLESGSWLLALDCCCWQGG